MSRFEKIGESYINVELVEKVSHCDYSNAWRLSMVSGTIIEVYHKPEFITDEPI